MLDPIILENAFQEFTKNYPNSPPDGVMKVDLALIHELGLLNYDQLENTSTENLMHYFHVLETPDKVTLFNEQFAVWIVPKLVDNSPTTLTFIALVPKGQKLHLEMVFSTSGVYNTPRFILKILQHFLTEVIDTEKIISAMDKPINPQ